ncbi:glycosyl transferase family 2 [Actinoplanes subtropicus]|uniref:glycosyl transferase family 2 n=1 Tax=Actinoplanes subtropicus TaxID=543632 RepID=UPI0012F8ED72|nr:glycosyl transferase family 2 [Actinoplanes subtropicus]
MDEEESHGSDTARRICVGIATYDDFDATWFTIQAIRLYQHAPGVMISFVVVDNHPEGPESAALRKLELSIPELTYVPFSAFSGTAVVDVVFQHADAEVVCCLDSHVALAPNALAVMNDWFADHPRSLDLLQGPLLNEDLTVASTHLQRCWGSGMFGTWATDERVYSADREPFEIDMQGLGFFACLKSTWPKLNPRLRGFSVNEGYLHEKIRKGGGRVLCHPALGWLHRFARPRGIPYPNSLLDRARNYYIAWREIGWDPVSIDRHFTDLLGDEAEAATLLSFARHQANNPTGFFDGVVCLARDGRDCGAHHHPASLSWRIEKLGERAEELAEVETTWLFASALRYSVGRGYRHLLIVGAGSGTSDDVLNRLDPSVLERERWDLCVVHSGEDIATSERSGSKSSAELKLSALAGLAITRRAMLEILEDLPAGRDGITAFIAHWGSLERYLASTLTNFQVVTLAVDELDGPAPITATHPPSIFRIQTIGMAAASAAIVVLTLTSCRSETPSPTPSFSRGGDVIPTMPPPLVEPTSNHRGIDLPPAATTTRPPAPPSLSPSVSPHRSR